MAEKYQSKTNLQKPQSAKQNIQRAKESNAFLTRAPTSSISKPGLTQRKLEVAAVPVTILERLIKIGKCSICRIRYRNRMQGTACLIETEHKDRLYHLLITCNHVLPFTAVYDLCQVELHFQGLNAEMHNISLKREWIDFAWTSSSYSYDATIIELTEIASQWFQSKGVEFLKVSNNDSKKRDQIGLVQYPASPEYPDGELSFSSGEICKFDDIALYYLADGAQGSSGSPVLSYEGTVIAIHNSEIQSDPMYRPGSASRQTRSGTMLKEILLVYFEDNNFTNR